MPERPRVGLLSIGEEDAKGNELVKQARQMLKADSQLNFVGNVEGRDVVRGVVDVVTCEGFVGNVVLKLTEGLAEGLMKMLGQFVAAADSNLGQAVAPILQKLWQQHDYGEHGEWHRCWGWTG